MLNVQPTNLKTWNHFQVPTLGMGTWHHGPKHEIQVRNVMKHDHDYA